MIRTLCQLVLTLWLATGAVTAQESVSQISATSGQGGPKLTIRSTTDYDVMRPALAAFAAEHPTLSMAYEQWGSNALYDLSLADCASGQPAADVILSSAVHQMVDLVNRACGSAYRSDLTEGLPAARVWRDELWGITNEAAVIIYNTALVPAGDVPRTRFALLDLMRQQGQTYRGRIATYDIEESGLGYLFAFVDSLEASTFGALLEGFARTDAVATCCSAEIIRGVAEGRYLIAYNVLGSYVDARALRDIGVIRPEDYTLFLSRAYMIPRDADQPEWAAALLDFLLSPAGQDILAESQLVDRQGSEDTGLPDSARRDIAIEPTLLVAGDQHRRVRFIGQWRSAFGQIATD